MSDSNDGSTGGSGQAVLKVLRRFSGHGQGVGVISPLERWNGPGLSGRGDGYFEAAAIEAVLVTIDRDQAIAQRHRDQRDAHPK